MKKIVIDGRESGTSSGRYTDKLIEYLAKLDTDFSFVVLTKKHRLNYVRQIAPKFEIVQTDFKEFTFGEQLGYRSQIAGLKPDLVHFLFVQQPILYRGKVATTIQDLTTVRFVSPGKNLLVYKFKQQVYKQVIKTAAKKSLEIITPTKFVKDDVVDFTGQNPDKFTVTLEAADKIPDKSEPLTKLEGKKFIMYVGRPAPHKNLPRLIEAFAKLKETHPDLHLALAGKKDAGYQMLEASVNAMGVKDVVFTDFISEGQLKWLYENCQAYVFPSLSEGFGLPPLEAMVHGAPVVSSNVSCMPEVNGDAAEYFDPLNTDEMAKVIAKVLGNDGLRKQMSEKGYKQAAKYSWKRMAEQTLEVYKKVLSD